MQRKVSSLLKCCCHSVSSKGRKLSSKVYSHVLRLSYWPSSVAAFCSCCRGQFVSSCIFNLPTDAEVGWTISLPLQVMAELIQKCFSQTAQMQHEPILVQLEEWRNPAKFELQMCNCRNYCISC